MDKLRVAVLRGGPAHQYDTSLRSGAAVLQNLNTDRYQPIDVFIDKAGEWHVLGLPWQSADVFDSCDVVVNALHGPLANDEDVYQALQSSGVPHTGTTFLGLDAPHHRGYLRKALARTGVAVPRHIHITGADATTRTLTDIFRSFTLPYIVAPSTANAAVHGVHVGTYHDFLDAVEAVFQQTDGVCIGECPRGVHVSLGVVENYRDEDHYVSIPVVVSGGRIDAGQKDEIIQLAKNIHQALGLRHYSRSDFIASPRGIFLYDADPFPPLGDDSHTMESLEMAGCNQSQFLDHIIGLATTQTAR